MQAGIHFIAKQKYNGDQLNPDHHSDKGPNGTIHFVITSKVGNVKGEHIRNSQDSQCSQY